MARDNSHKKNAEAEFLERIFGDLAELGDEELDILFESAAPGENASAVMHAITERAAAQYRKAGKVPPEHVDAALRATRQDASLEGAKPPLLKRIVESLRPPTLGPVGDLSFSYRNRKDVTEGDKKALDELAGELNEDWQDEEKQ
jgi:hypothetical protein